MFYVVINNKIQTTQYDVLTDEVLEWAAKNDATFFETDEKISLDVDKDGNIIPTDITQDQLKQKVSADITAYRDSILDNGVEFEGITFYSDKTSNKDLFIFGVSNLSNGQSVPIWKGKDGWLTDPSLEQLISLYTLCCEQLSECYVKEAQLISSLENLNMKQLESFDVGQEWDQ